MRQLTALAQHYRLSASANLLANMYHRIHCFQVQWPPKACETISMEFQIALAGYRWLVPGHEEASTTGRPVVLKLSPLWIPWPFYKVTGDLAPFKRKKTHTPRTGPIIHRTSLAQGFSHWPAFWYLLPMIVRPNTHSHYLPCPGTYQESLRQFLRTGHGLLMFLKGH